MLWFIPISVQFAKNGDDTSPYLFSSSFMHVSVDVQRYDSVLQSWNAHMYSAALVKMKTS